MRIVLVWAYFFIQAQCLSQISINSLQFEIRVNVTRARSISLVIQTQKIFPSKSNVLELSYSVTKRTTKVALEGITVPQIMDFATGPSEAKVDLGTLKKGTYVITVSKGTSIAVCKLRLRQKDYILRVVQKAFLVNKSYVKADYLP